MKFIRLSTVLIFFVASAQAQNTYNTSKDSFGNTTTRFNDETTIRQSTDSFGNQRGTITKPYNASDANKKSKQQQKKLYTW